MKKKGWLWGAFGCFVGYLLLLIVLASAERRDPNSSIQDIWDALWYSIVTLSTVGYGDLYPVTPLGKVIGLLFVLLSVGALAFLVGSVVSLLTGRVLPELRLRLLRGRKWYIFSKMNESALALASSLSQREPDSVLLFPAADKTKTPSGLNCHYYPDTISRAVSGKTGQCDLFFMAEEGNDNYQQALEALPLGHGVYCRTEHEMDHCPENLTLFNRYECCAREYWNSQPLGFSESTVLLIGDGQYAHTLLERGLMMNVFGEDHCVHYHVFGGWQDFCRNHPQLALTVCVNSDGGNRDSLYFHEGPWNSDCSLLYDAHRIILCSDDEQENLNVLRLLRRYFPVTGSIHLRNKMDIPGETTFGTDRRIYTAENVIRSRLTAAARAMHRIYCSNAGGEAPAWEKLSEFTRQSNIAAADHLLVKVRLLLRDETVTELTRKNCETAYRRFLATLDTHRDAYRAIEHLRWMRFHSLYNWRFAPVRDNAARLHPLMVPFESLSEAEQSKDEYAWRLLEPMAKEIEKNTEE